MFENLDCGLWFFSSRYYESNKTISQYGQGLKNSHFADQPLAPYGWDTKNW